MNNDQLEALHAAATSLETISRLAGRKSYGDPAIPTYMETFMEVRQYAAARAKVAREALAASPMGSADTDAPSTPLQSPEGVEGRTAGVGGTPK